MLQIRIFPYFLQAILSSLDCMRSCVNVADGVVFIVACSEGATDAGTVLSVFYRIIGNISAAGG
jgi:hypothetical protein